MIKVENAVKIYGTGNASVRALDHLSMTVEEGEMVAVMGTSGSGKSTLFNILGGMDCLTEGEYLFRGEHIEKYSQRKLDDFRKENISFVFQNFALMSLFTIRENLEMPLENRGIKRKQRLEVVHDVLDSLGILELEKKMPGELSGGQQQRCAIARALVVDSPVILADEPTGSLDRANTDGVMSLFQKIHQKGKTILIITHDEHVASYAQRIIHLEDGKCVN